MPSPPTTAPSGTLPKPALRGWLHAAAVPLVLVGGVLLVLASPSPLGRLGSAIWLAGSLILFGTSAAYHLGQWSPPVLALLRRLDHANIFVFIAATYTPLALSLLERPGTLLILIWVTALAGITATLAWPNRPRWVDAVLYLALGWAGVGWLGAFWAAGGPAVVILILTGGVIYSFGAVVYARRKPDPSPRWFGFHEVFHTCTIAAAGCHFAAIALAVLG